MGLIRAAAASLGREPARAASASSIPSDAPTHQVAMIPQPMPSNVGDRVAWRMKNREVFNADARGELIVDNAKPNGRSDTCEYNF